MQKCSKSIECTSMITIIKQLAATQPNSLLLKNFTAISEEFLTNKTRNVCTKTPNNFKYTVFICLVLVFELRLKMQYQNATDPAVTRKIATKS